MRTNRAMRRPPRRVMLPCVEELPRAEEQAGISGTHETGAAAASAVQNEHGVAHDAAGVLPWLADGPVVQPDLLRHFPALEAHVTRHEVAFDRCRKRRLPEGRRRGQQERPQD